MSRSILDTKGTDYQLISLGIEIVHKYLSLVEMQPEVLDSYFGTKVHQLVKEWNQSFINTYALTTKEGG